MIHKRTDFKDDFAKRLKSVIKDKGLTLKEVADMANIAQSTMSDYTQGKRMPDLYSFKKIAKVLDVNADELMGEDK